MFLLRVVLYMAVWLAVAVLFEVLFALAVERGLPHGRRSMMAAYYTGIITLVFFSLPGLRIDVTDPQILSGVLVVMGHFYLWGCV